VPTSTAAVAAGPRGPFEVTLTEQQQGRLLAASERYLTAKRHAKAAAVEGARQDEAEDHRLRRLGLLRTRLDVARLNYDKTLAELGFSARHPS